MQASAKGALMLVQPIDYFLVVWFTLAVFMMIVQVEP